MRFCDTSGELVDKVSHEGVWPWGFANVDMFLCCFDVTSLGSLEHIRSKWAPLVRKLCLDAPIVRFRLGGLVIARLTPNTKILCGLKAEYRFLEDESTDEGLKEKSAIPMAIPESRVGVLVPPMVFFPTYLQFLAVPTSRT